jgi:hypothetical protein
MKIVSVIPGRPEGPDPESIRRSVGLWIPGLLALLAPRNDKE